MEALFRSVSSRIAGVDVCFLDDFSNRWRLPSGPYPARPLGWEWGNISEITEAVFGCVLSRTAGVGVG